MSPLLKIVIDKLLDYVAGHSDEIVAQIKKEFLSAETNPQVKEAVVRLANEPTQESLNDLHTALQANGEDPEKLGTILLNNASA